MGRFNKFSCKKFCIVLALACCTTLCVAQADDDTNTNPETVMSAEDVFNWDTKLKNYFAENAVEGTPNMIRTLCPRGSYLARCGSSGTSLGTNWLKGMQKTLFGVLVKTPDYYSYGTSSYDTTNIINLRNFFTAEEWFTYHDNDNNRQKANPQQYVIHRNQILSHFCTDDEGTLVGIECEKCPGDAFVEASTVELTSEENNRKILWKTWNVHTIADCYAEEFSDATGTYKYVPTGIVLDKDSAPAPCYYSVNVPGDTLY